MTDIERAAWLWTAEPKTPDEKFSLLLVRWRVDPVCCAVECLRTVLLPYQAQALLDLFDAPAEVYEFYQLDPSFPKRQVVLPSGHGLGKTRILAVAIWVKLITYRFSRALCTAPTFDQLTGQLWGEVRKLYRRMSQAQPHIAEEWNILGSSIAHKDPAFGDWCAQARTARAEKPDGLQGAHALDADDEFGDIAKLFRDEIDTAPSGGILLVVEEGSGVTDEIYQVLDGAMSEQGAQMIQAGNPTRNDGRFAENAQNGKRYAIHRLDCRMSNREIVYTLPYRDFAGRVHNLRMHGFVQPKYWQDLLDECGGDEDHDRFRVRVKGMLPRSNLEQVIPTNWVTSAMKREPHESIAGHRAVVGLDFGLSGDKHALAVRRHTACVELDEWLPPERPNDITMHAARRGIDAVETHKAGAIVGDANGVGRGAMEYLWDYFMVKHPELRVRVIMFNSGKRASKPRFYRLRDEMWYGKGRQWLSDPHCSLPDDPRLTKQLCAPSAHEDESKRISVESKDEVKRRTGEPSGNKADALLQTLMTDLPIEDTPAEEKPAGPPELFKKHFARWARSRTESGAIR